MVMSMLTACGGGSEETSTDTAAEEVVEEEDTAEDSAADGMCSDETFSALQDNYASLSGYTGSMGACRYVFENLSSLSCCRISL